MNNWYLDFDSTLYNTGKLTNDMLNSLASYISQTRKIEKEEILNKLSSMFNRENIYNIFTLCKYFETKYLLPADSLSKIIDHILINGSRYVYDDVIQSLENMRKNTNQLNILTYASGSDNIAFQMQKISGSGISKYFDSLIITSEPKHTLDLKYENGIFVDDNPTDLQNLYKKGAKKIIRIKRDGNKYSTIKMNNPEIHEYTTLSEIFLKEEERTL